MKNNLRKLLFTVASIFLAAPLLVLADEKKAIDLLTKVGDKSGYVTTGGTGDIFSLIGTIISTALSILGVIFVVLMVYAGYNWLTAMGDQAKVEKAKDTIWRSIIGLIIVVSAYAIWAFVSLAL